MQGSMNHRTTTLATAPLSGAAGVAASLIKRLTLLAVLLPWPVGARAQEAGGAGSDVVMAPAAEPSRLTWGVAYENTGLTGEWGWGARQTFSTPQGPDTVTADFLRSSPRLHVLRGLAARRRWLGQHLGWESILSLGVGVAAEQRWQEAGAYGTYQARNRFSLVDFDGSVRGFLLWRTLFVECGLVWQRVFSSARLSDGVTSYAVSGSEDSIGGRIAVGAEHGLSGRLRIGLSLGAEGFIKGFGPFPGRNQVRLYVTW
jgi:hypothetical protein